MAPQGSGRGGADERRPGHPLAPRPIRLVDLRPLPRCRRGPGDATPGRLANLRGYAQNAQTPAAEAGVRCAVNAHRGHVETVYHKSGGGPNKHGPRCAAGRRRSRHRQVATEPADRLFEAGRRTSIHRSASRWWGAGRPQSRCRCSMWWAPDMLRGPGDGEDRDGAPRRPTREGGDLVVSLPPPCNADATKPCCPGTICRAVGAVGGRTGRGLEGRELPTGGMREGWAGQPGREPHGQARTARAAARSSLQQPVPGRRNSTGRAGGPPQNARDPSR